MLSAIALSRLPKRQHLMPQLSIPTSYEPKRHLVSIISCGPVPAFTFTGHGGRFSAVQYGGGDGVGNDCRRNDHADEHGGELGEGCKFKEAISGGPKSARNPPTSSSSSSSSSSAHRKWQFSRSSQPTKKYRTLQH